MVAEGTLASVLNFVALLSPTAVCFADDLDPLFLSS
jgi:hypothetical protein